VSGFVTFQVGDLTYAQVNLDSAGQATWVNGTGGPPLGVGTDTINAVLLPYSAGWQASTGTLAETFSPLGTVPAPTFAPPAGSYTSTQAVALNLPNPPTNTYYFYYTTDGSTPVAGVSNEFLQGMTIYVNASETIQAIASAPGYSASSVASAAYTITLPPSGFTLSGTAVTLYPGATTGNTPTITVTPSGGFTGSVALTAAVTSSPTGTQDPPNVSFGSASPCRNYQCRRNGHTDHHDHWHIQQFAGVPQTHCSSLVCSWWFCPRLLPAFRDPVAA
jgi:hypothetical protein